MGTRGQTSVQICFKVNKQLKEKIDREIEATDGTQAEFMNDAVKFYIDYLENKRLELWRMEKEKAESEEDPSGHGGN